MHLKRIILVFSLFLIALFGKTQQLETSNISLDLNGNLEDGIPVICNSNDFLIEFPIKENQIRIVLDPTTLNASIPEIEEAIHSNFLSTITLDVEFPGEGPLDLSKWGSDPLPLEGELDIAQIRNELPVEVRIRQDKKNRNIFHLRMKGEFQLRDFGLEEIYPGLTSPVQFEIRFKVTHQ